MITRFTEVHMSCLRETRFQSSFGQVHIKYAANRIERQQIKSCMFNVRDDETTDPHGNIRPLQRQK